LYVLSKVELSFAYPFLSLAYVAVAIFAYFIFREDLNGWRIAGITFICVGTVLIAQSGRDLGGRDLGGRGHDEETASLSSDKIQSGIVR
ncbi:MAG: transporter, partial [Mesorhizobium sp.]